MRRTKYSRPAATLPWLLAIALSCPWAAQIQPVQLDESLQERAQARLRTVRVRIQPTWNAEPGACLGFGIDDLEVALRGQRIDRENIEFDRQQMRTLHALLVDTSGSMAPEIDRVRPAVAEYVERLHVDHERAFIVTFDDSVLLHQAVTGDRQTLSEATETIRPGGLTQLHDGVHHVIQEMTAHRERAVIVLLSDGVDSSSFHLREDVMEAASRHPDLTIFSIAFQLPPLTVRKHLQRLATRTNGKYFEAPTSGRLDNVYRRIREMLDNEAILRVVDPQPGAAAGKLRVSSTRRSCRIEVFHSVETAADPLREPIARPYPELPQSFPVPPNPRYLKSALNRAHHVADPDCAEGPGPSVSDPGWQLEDLSWLRAERDGIRGCLLDVTMETGLLYDFSAMTPGSWAGVNDSIRTKSRPFEIPLVPFDRLPQRPEQLMDEMARFALEVIDDDIERDYRKRPPDLHARPYHDWPSLIQGNTFFDLRAQIAAALFLYPEYRGWVLGQLQQEARQDLDELRQRFRRRAPGSSEHALDLAVQQSEEGQRILQRAQEPSPRDLTRYLSAWLGDIPAHDLFLRWETERLNAVLGGLPDLDTASFFEEWQALRQMFCFASYTRVLTLLTPTYDPVRDRVGFYRVILPRPGWYTERLANRFYHPGWRDLPLDLVPDLPLAYWAAERVFREEPELVAHLARHGYEVEQLDYALLMKPRKQTPKRGFETARVSVRFRSKSPAASTDGPRLLLQADVSLNDRQPRLTATEFSVEGDPVLADLSRDAQTRLATHLARTRN